MLIKKLYSSIYSNNNLKLGKNTVLRKYATLKAPITVTNAASERLQFLITQYQDIHNVKGIRLGVKKKGCNGLSYTMNYICDTDEDLKKVKNDDIVVCNNNIKVYIEPKAIITIVGTTMDFIETEINSEFTFINPNSKGSCGCGESFLT
jgi:iron-sulfur cluster assembly accessory protein